MNISMSIPGSSSNRFSFRRQDFTQCLESAGCLGRNPVEGFLILRREKRHTEAVQGSVGLEYHPNVGVCLFGCCDFAPMYVVETGTHVLYQSAVGTQAMYIRASL